ncbi:hypothetical protein ETB97_011757, partial [Aspergillus alliaceus]
MTDLTPILNTLLSQHNKPPMPIPPTKQNYTTLTDEFLKEAYRITKHTKDLNTYLRKIRPQYLSLTSHPRHKPASAPGGKEGTGTLSDADRDQIDSSTSLVLHDLSNSIATLSSAEDLRHQAAESVLRR